MKNKRIIIIIATALFLVSMVALFKYFQPSRKHTGLTIGILQTASHPALDQARQGFIEEVQKSLGNKVEFVIRNGEGSINTIHALAQQFHAKDDINAVYAIATPAAQAMISVEKERPLFIAAVTVSPEIETIKISPNVCGTSDMINVKEEIAAMKTLLPTVTTVGVLFSISEINAVAVANMMISELEKIGCNPLPVGFTSQADMIPAVESALRKVDALIAPTDNNVASGITLLADIALRAKKPLIVSDNTLVAHGALMARGVDYYASGQQTGQLAVAVLRDGKKPQELSIASTQSDTLVINTDVAKQLGITVPRATSTTILVNTIK